jgi:hypothetical protein
MKGILILLVISILLTLSLLGGAEAYGFFSPVPTVAPPSDPQPERTPVPPDVPPDAGGDPVRLPETPEEPILIEDIPRTPETPATAPPPVSPPPNRDDDKGAQSAPTINPPSPWRWIVLWSR